MRFLGRSSRACNGTSTAAALVGAAVLSTLFFPALGLRLRGHSEAEKAAVVAEV